MNKKGQVFFAILAGILTMWLVGWALLLALTKAITHGPNFFYGAGELNAVVINGVVFLWLGTASFCGGLVTAFAAPGRNIFYALVAGIITFVLLLGYSFFMHAMFGFSSLLAGLSIIIFSLMGGLVQQKIALSKYETV